MWQRTKFLSQLLTVKKSKSRWKEGINLATTMENDNNLEGEIPPKESQVVICGGGVMGAAVAYHLSLMGLGSQTVIVESSRSISKQFHLSSFFVEIIIDYLLLLL